MAAFERATVGLFIWWSANNAFAADPASVLSVSRFGVAETADRIEADVRSRGLAVVEHTDHAGFARRDGLRIRPAHTLRIDHGSGGAPTRLVIWQAQSGCTVVSVDERPIDATHRSGEVLPRVVRALAPASQPARPG
jgi:uncharacterized protein (DUF302 family)